MNVYQEIREIESQIKDLNEKKKELERSLTSGFLESGGLALLQGLKWSCHSPDADYMVSHLNDYTARIFRVKMGLTDLYGSINLDADRGVSLIIDDDDVLCLSVPHGGNSKIIDIIRDYELKLDLTRNRSDVRFQEKQLEYARERLEILEEFAVGDEI